MTVSECNAKKVAEPTPQDRQDPITAFSANELLAIQPDKWIQLQRLAMTGQLMPCLAHDIVQPISSICNFTGGLQKRISDGRLSTEELSETLASISKEALRTSSMVSRLRNFSKSNTDQLTLTSVNDSIRESLEFARGFLCSEQVIVSTVLTESVHRIFANSNRFQQVLLNLIVNAAEALRELPCRSRSIEITTSECNGSVKIAIKDSGPRIPEDVFVNLTRPFYTTKHSALGLGLWACKSIVEDLNGELMLKQVSPQGLEAIVRLPISN